MEVPLQKYGVNQRKGLQGIIAFKARVFERHIRCASNAERGARKAGEDSVPRHKALNQSHDRSLCTLVHQKVIWYEPSGSLLDMKTSVILLAFAVAAAVPCGAGSSPAVRRDEALQKIEACVRRNEVASRQCKHLNRNIQTLVDTYRDGDKSVLPVLLKFTYLTDFYDEALLSDPEGFLATVQQLPEKEQREVAVGIAGRYFRPVPKTQFVALRSLLTSVPESSPLRSLAQECLKQLETNNASLFVDYFPPQTFAGPTAAFDIFWYSRELYGPGREANVARCLAGHHHLSLHAPRIFLRAKERLTHGVV